MNKIGNDRLDIQNWFMVNIVIWLNCYIIIHRVLEFYSLFEVLAYWMIAN